MSRCSAQVLALLALLGTPASLPCQDFQVELFTNHKPRAIELQAGREALRICELDDSRRCLHAGPGTVAQCAISGQGVECRSKTGALLLRSASLVSASPFRLDASSAERAREGGGQGAIALRSAFVRETQGGLRIITTVDLDGYVAGVLAGEASTLKSREGLEAMAVLARTWALRGRGRHRAEGFDFCDLTHCQVFRAAAPAGQYATAFTEAVRRTQGEVLEFHAALADPFFSADCGGVTEAAGDVWPDKRAPYLTSIPDPYCASSSHSRWQRSLSLKTAEQVLRDILGQRFEGPLLDLSVAEKDASGRTRTLAVHTARTSQAVVLDANEFRYAVGRRLGWDTLKSNLYTIERRGTTLIFTGRGLGHGVGLCQAGADEMGRLGISHERILATYFPGTIVSKLASQDPDPIASSEHFELDHPISQKAWVSETLATLEAFRAVLGDKARALPARVRVRTWDATAGFIQATGQPGWAAATTDGESIALQPLAALKQKGILRSTLRHELAHLVVHACRAPGTPQWFEEGLALHLTGEQIAPAAQGAPPSERDLETAVAHPRSEAEMRRAYARALALVQRLERERGEVALWQVLERPSAADKEWLSREAKSVH